MPQQYGNITGVILAGGKSRRMGRDKALLSLGGRTFIQIITTTLQQVFDTVVISSNDAEKFASLGVQVIPDIHTDCGPLGGIQSALRCSKTPDIFVTMCDAPFISAGLVRFLIESSNIGRIAVAEESGIIHPLFGLYPVSVLPRAEQFLERGERKVLDFLSGKACDTIDVSSWEHELRNMNDPLSYAQFVKEPFNL